MGFLKHLLFWPVTGPMYLTEFSLGKVQGVVKDQLTDDSRVKEELLDLQLALELGEIDEEDFEREEARLMMQLREVRRWRQEFGMGTRGGVVQMGDAARPSEGTGDEDGGGAGTSADDAGEPGDAGTVVGGGTRATLDISLDWDADEPTADESDGPASIADDDEDR